MNGDEPTALYKLYDEVDALLYVGVSFDLHTRFCDHRLAKPWYRVARIELTWYPDRKSALAAETHVIQTQTPPWNWNGSPTPPGPPRKFEWLMNWITEQVEAGEWPVGEQIPPAEEAARQLGTMRAVTVRKAMRGLVERGVLCKRGGKYFIAERVTADG